MARPAAGPRIRAASVWIVGHVGTRMSRTYHMENTKKEELIEELEAILKANKKNLYCDEYQIADMIKEALKLHDV
jgi:hypothetical protein